MNDIDKEDDLLCRLDLACGDLLSAKQYEPTLIRLFTEMSAGEWMLLTNSLPTDLDEDVYAAWLQMPKRDDPQLRFVLLLHEESGWSMTATYNVNRLLRSKDEPE